ncbi:hypothetical protein V1264_007757 [Littorina saxatilis]|uniref:Uncharacterized protein n=1 Tax=Littorina saxatilis TaxID=31220 RepID=A0AAN9AX33_9CAEN
MQKYFFDNVWSNKYYMQEVSRNRYIGAAPTDETFSNFHTPADELQDSSKYLNRRGDLRQVSCDSSTDGSQQGEDKRCYTGLASGGPSGSHGGPIMPTIREAWQTSDDSGKPSLKKGEGKRSLLKKRSSSGSMSKAKRLAESIAEHEVEPEGAASKEDLVSLSSGGGKEKGLFRQKAVPVSNASPTVKNTITARLATLSESEAELGKEEVGAEKEGAEEVGIEAGAVMEEEEKMKEVGTEEEGTEEAGEKQEEEEPTRGRSMSRTSSLAGDDIRKSITQMRESENHKSSLPETNSTSEPSEGSQQNEGAPHCQSHSAARLDWQLKQHYWFLHYSRCGTDRDTYPIGESAVSAGGNKAARGPGGANKHEGGRPRPNISPSKAEAIASSGEKGVNSTPTNSPSHSPCSSRSTSRTEKEPAGMESHASKKQPFDSIQSQTESCEGFAQTPEVSPPVAEPEITAALNQPPDDGDGGSSACAPSSVDLQTPGIILTASSPLAPESAGSTESDDVFPFEGGQQNTRVSDGDQASSSTRPAKGTELDDKETSVIPLDLEQAQVLGSEVELAMKNAEPRAASAPDVIESAVTGSDTLQAANHASGNTPTSLTTPEDKPATSSTRDPALSRDHGNGSVPMVIVSSPRTTPSPSPCPSPAPPAKPAASPRKGIAVSPNAMKRTTSVPAGAKGHAKTKAKSTAAVAPYCVIKQPASKAASRGVGPVSATSGTISVSPEAVRADNVSTAATSVTARDAPRVSFSQDEATAVDIMAQRSKALNEPQA